MNRKIYVTASEMLALREQGMSNHDIAKSLDVSYNTVVRYIGNQGKRMDSFEAFRDTPLKTEKTKEVVMTTIYDPKPVVEKFKVGGFEVELDGISRIMTVTGDGGNIMLEYESVPDLVQFIAWAMRKRMEVREDADKLQAEGRTI